MSEAAAPVKVMGRYALFREIAAGGMAVVHLGRLQGPVGFSRTVAIKRLYPQYARDPEFVSMFLDEARLAARIRHPNVVPTLDVVASAGELFLVMDYVHGDSLARLLRAAASRQERVPLPVILAVACGALGGLHAAHEARGARGEPLGIVHRDVSPQNILVGSDGVPRIVDFGVAKAAGRVQTTRDGQVKGKMGYFAPEQVTGMVTRRTDLFAMGIVIWEAIAGRRLFRGENDATTLFNLLHATVPPPSTFAPEVSPALDAALLRALERDPQKRYESAREMAIALEESGRMATTNEVAAWVERLAVETLTKRSRFLAEVEGSGDDVIADASSVEDLMAGHNDEAGHESTRSDSSSSRLPAAALAVPPPSLPGPLSQPSPRSSAATLEVTLEAPRSAVSRPPPAESTSLSVSKSMDVPALPPPPSKRWPIALGGATLLVAVLAFFVTRSAQRPASLATGVPSASAAPVASPPAATVDLTPPPTETAKTAEARAEEAVPAPKPAPKAPLPRPAPPAAKKPDGPSKAPVVKAPSPDCSTPYKLDAAGRKKWKPECL